MSLQKIKINTKNNVSMSIILEDITEFYCDLRISGNPDMLDLNLHGKKIFNGRYFHKNELSNAEILDLVKKYVVNLSNEYNVPLEILFKELTKAENNLQKKFKGKLYSYFVNRNKIITQEMTSSILHGDFSKITSIAREMEIKDRKKLQQRKSFSDYIRDITDTRKKEGKKILREKQIQTKKQNQPNVRKNIRIVSSNNLVLDRFVDKLLLNTDYQVNCPNDISKFITSNDKIVDTTENLQEIFNIYSKKQKYFNTHNLNQELVSKIYELGVNSYNTKMRIFNDQHVIKILKDELGIDSANEEMVKIFYEGFKK